ncbi:hypothetical protein Y032_0452g1702 [Ancylostoma ceylanicum]|nr:hypothetical protein Y032_0452g1702 [Ancylostoma ceylanicum]
METVFDDYERANNFWFTRKTLKRQEGYNSNGLLKAQYELKKVDCLQFQKFLLSIRSNRYHLRNVHVFCGSYTYTLCMAFECPQEESRKLMKKI